MTVIFEKEISDERDDSWKQFKFYTFKGIILKGIKVATDRALCFSVIKYLKQDKYDTIVCMNIASPTGMLAMQYMQLKNIPYWIKADGGFAKNRKGIKESIKRYFISKAVYCLSTSKELDYYFLTYGADKQRILRYPFSSIYENNIKIPKNDLKIKIRKQLNVLEDNVLLSVGRFIHQKGFDVLIKAMSKVSNNIGVYLVGGEPDEYYKKLVSEYNLTNIHFVGYKKRKI